MAILDLQNLKPLEVAPGPDAISTFSIAWCDGLSIVSLAICG